MRVYRPSIRCVVNPLSGCEGSPRNCPAIPPAECTGAARPEGLLREESSSQRTLCWRKTDSNHRSRRERDGRGKRGRLRPDGEKVPFSPGQGLHRKPVSLMRGYRLHVDSLGIRTVQSGSCAGSLRSAACCTCQRSLPTPLLQAPIGVGPGSFSFVRRRRFVPFLSWRKAFRPALRYGLPACAGQSRHRHGSGEPPCMRRRFPAASCRLPGQGPDR